MAFKVGHAAATLHVELVLRVLTALLMTTAAGLVLLGAEAWCQAFADPMTPIP